MISINDILEFLGFDRIPASECNNIGGTLVHKLCKDDEAKHGCMSWTNREDIGKFTGILLFNKELVENYPREGIMISERMVVIHSHNPRLAFLRAANEFFPELMKDEKVREVNNGVIKNCEIGRNVTFGSNCSIGFQGFGIELGEGGYERFPHIGKVIIEDNVEIGSNVCIDRGALGNTVIKSGARIDNLVHIAHNVVVGNDSVIVANAMIGGSTVIGNDVWIGPSASLMNGIMIGDGAVIGMGAVVLKDVEAGATMVGNPARKL